jgi:hypothetical protein
MLILSPSRNRHPPLCPRCRRPQRQVRSRSRILPHWRGGVPAVNAAGDFLLDADGNFILDASGNIRLSDGAGDACCCEDTSCYATVLSSALCTSQTSPVLTHPPDAFEVSWSVGTTCTGTCIKVDQAAGLFQYSTATSIPTSGTMCCTIASATSTQIRYVGSTSAGSPYGTYYGNDSTCTTAVRDYTTLQVELFQVNTLVHMRIRILAAGTTPYLRVFAGSVAVADPRDCFGTRSFTSDYSACHAYPASSLVYEASDRAIVAYGGSAAAVACAC